MYFCERKKKKRLWIHIDRLDPRSRREQVSRMTEGVPLALPVFYRKRLFVERVDQVGVGLSDSFDGVDFGEDQLG